jgi:hypothetical protein
MRTVLAFLVVALVVGCNGPTGDLKPAGKVSIEGKTSVSDHKLVRLTAGSVPAGAQVRWQVTPSDGVDMATTTQDRLEFVAEPGEYQVRLTVLDKANPATPFDEAEIKVSVGGRFGGGKYGGKTDK